MADSTLFIGWGFPVRGREAKAAAFFNDSVKYWTGLQQNGQIESFEVALLDPHGGELSGFALLRGSPEQLARLRGSPDFRRMVTRAQLMVEHLGVVGAILGQALTEQMGVFQTQVNEVG